MQYKLFWQVMQYHFMSFMNIHETIENCSFWVFWSLKQLITVKNHKLIFGKNKTF